MAVTPIFICGGECGIAAIGALSAGTEHWSDVQGTATVAVAPASRGGKAQRLQGANSWFIHTFAGAVGSPATVVWRTFVYFATLPSVSGLISFTTGGKALGVYFNAADSTIRAGETTLFAGSGFTVSTGTWYRLDVKAVLNTTTTVDLSVNGAAQTQYSVAGAAAAQTQYAIQGYTTGDIYFDDTIVSGTSADFPVGDGKVVALYPNGDLTNSAANPTDSNFGHFFSATNDFGKGAGGTGVTGAQNVEATSWQSLANPLSTAIGTNFIGALNGTNTEHLVWTHDVMPNATTINGVMVVMATHSATTTANQFAFKLGRKVNANRSTVIQNDLSEATITVPISIQTGNASAQAWTQALLDDSTFIFGDSNDVTPDVFLDGVCMEVDYVPLLTASYVSPTLVPARRVGDALFAMRRVRGSEALPVQAQIPVPPFGPPTFAQRRAIRGAPVRRAHLSTPVPAQVIIIPGFVPPTLVQVRRIRGLRRVEGSQSPPVLPQTPVPPYIPIEQVQPRRVRGWRIFRARLVSPVPAPVAVPPYIPQEQVQQRRVRGWRLFRGRQATPVPASIAVPPFNPPSIVQPRRARGWRIFRGSQIPVPPAPQTAVVLPPSVSAPQPRRVRGWRVFRRALGMVPAQELVPGNAERRVHRLGRKARGSQATPVPGQVPVPSYPVPTTQRRALRGWRMFRGSQPTNYPNSVSPNTPPPYPVPNIARRVQRLWLARRGKQAPVVPAQVPVPPTPPVTAVQPRRARGWRLARPGRPSSAATLQAAAVLGRGAASRQRIPAPRRRARAVVFGVSDAPPSTLDPARRPQMPGRRWGRARTPVPTVAVAAASGPLTRTARRRQPLLARIRRYLRWVPGVGGTPADPTIKYPLSLVVVSSGTTYAVVQVDGLLYALLTDGGVRYLAPQGSGATAVTPTSDGGSSLLVVSS